MALSCAMPTSYAPTITKVTSPSFIDVYEHMSIKLEEPSSDYDDAIMGADHMLMDTKDSPDYTNDSGDQNDDYEMTSWTKTHPLYWTRDEVLEWVYFVVQKMDLDGSQVCGEAYQSLTGSRLCHMSRHDFELMDPYYGSKLYDVFKGLISEVTIREPKSIDRTCFTTLEANNQPQRFSASPHVNASPAFSVSININNKTSSDNSNGSCGRIGSRISISSNSGGIHSCKQGREESPSVQLDFRSSHPSNLVVYDQDNDVKVDLGSLGVYPISTDFEFPPSRSDEALSSSTSPPTSSLSTSSSEFSTSAISSSSPPSSLASPSLSSLSSYSSMFSNAGANKSFKNHNNHYPYFHDHHHRQQQQEQPCNQYQTLHPAEGGLPQLSPILSSLPSLHHNNNYRETNQSNSTSASPNPSLYPTFTQPRPPPPSSSSSSLKIPPQTPPSSSSSSSSSSPSSSSSSLPSSTESLYNKTIAHNIESNSNLYHALTTTCSDSKSPKPGIPQSSSSSSSSPSSMAQSISSTSTFSMPLTSLLSSTAPSSSSLTTTPVDICSSELMEITDSDYISDEDLFAPCSMTNGDALSLLSSSTKKRGGRKNKSSQGNKGNHLWEFVRDLLHDPACNPRLLKWEDKETGVFRFVQSEAVAQLWGEKKKNPLMTYEKLSRAMRFCRTSGYFDNVPKNGKFPKKLCFMFGAKAHGWRQ